MKKIAFLFAVMIALTVACVERQKGANSGDSITVDSVNVDTVAVDTAVVDTL